MKDRIRQVREQNSLTITKFAEKLGLTVAAVSYYESGKRIPSNSVLVAISKEFNVSYAWLKTGEGPMLDPEADDST
ncbi:MAG: helix-turn-helix transcriptional regulator, partial [Erysipelotrichaceae bacterium]|nr:helix-turn-helix transcriptional regulator [Erysipelotrichaceae bacterium]